MVEFTQVQQYPESVLAERAGYFPVPGAHLYTVLHQVEVPLARVLLIGPFASERHTSYGLWLQWARYLAARRIEVVRFDYRGIGESTGVFAEMSFRSWVDDVERLSAWLRKREQNAPLILHGLGMGGLLAAKAFHNGEADALVMWSAPLNANKVLRSALQRWIGPQQLLKREEDRHPPSHYFRLLDEGQSVEVDGYEWTPELWRESLSFDLPGAMVPPNDTAASYRRPVRMVQLGKNAAPLVPGGLLLGFEESKDFSWLFAPNYEWIASSFGIPLEVA
jgi:pimeloyl-ACP methyl ester carboxylesterase